MAIREGKQLPLVQMTIEQIADLRAGLAGLIGEREREEALFAELRKAHRETIEALDQRISETARTIREQEGVEDGADYSVDPNPDANDPS